MSVEVKERRIGSVTVLELSGRLALGPLCDALDQKLQGLIAVGRPALLVDLSQVSGIDSVGIKTLVRGVMSAEKRGGKLKLLKISPRVREVLNNVHLLGVIECFDDDEAAVKSFAS